MKDFLRFAKTAFLVSIISAVVCSLFTIGALWLNISTYGKKDLRLSKKCHTVIVGNSLASCGFNDTILEPWINMGKFGDFYIDLAPILDVVLENNTQIDTVLLATGIPLFHNFTDTQCKNKNTGELTYSGKSILMDKDLMELNLRNNIYFYFYLLTNGMENLIESPNMIGQYYPLKYHTLMNNTDCGIKVYEAIRKKRGKLSFSLEEIEEEHKYQILGIKKLLKTCREHNVECILINTPLYNYKQYLSDDGYKDLLLTLGDSLLISDYTSFELPDTSYYCDVHHLNYSGSVYFSNYLKKNGLNTQYVIDYVKESIDQGIDINP